MVVYYTWQLTRYEEGCWCFIILVSRMSKVYLGGWNDILCCEPSGLVWPFVGKQRPNWCSLWATSTSDNRCVYMIFGYSTWLWFLDNQWILRFSFREKYQVLPSVIRLWPVAILWVQAKPGALAWSSTTASGFGGLDGWVQGQTRHRFMPLEKISTSAISHLSRNNKV